MISEFLIGRTAQANASNAFSILAPKTPWKWVGRVGILAATIILGYYLVVCGWTTSYFIDSLTGALQTIPDYKAHFVALQNNPIKQIAFVVFFTVLTSVFIIAGVQKGIEKTSKYMMSCLFLLLIVLAIRALLLPGAMKGLAFLFKPNVEHVKSTVLLDALGQTFFSLSLGMSVMITYGSYFNKSTNLPKTALQVSVLDAVVALLAGIIIFPSAFALTTSPDTITQDLIAGGPGLIFITFPDLFVNMPLSMLWASVFFFLLILAAVTSTISLLETGTVFVHEHYKLSRTTSTIIVALIIIVIGTLCSFSPRIFDALDFATAKVMLPLVGLPVSLFVGWYLDQQLVRDALTNGGTLHYGKRFLALYAFILRYIAPLGIMIIFIYGLLG